MKISEIAQFVDRMRTDGSAWAELDHHPQGAEDDDAHAEARHACLRGLQYDRRASDRDLIVHLLEQEIAWNRAMGGCSAGLKLAVHLAAELEDSTLIWQIAQAKHASFDASCALDVEALYTCGVERTMTIVEASDRPEREDFLYPPPQSQIDEWRDHQRRDFPVRWEEELNKVSACRDIGDFESAIGYFREELADALATVERGTKRERQLLVGSRYQWAGLGRPDEAALIQQKLDERLPEDSWNRASHLRDALEVYLAAGRLVDARERLEPLRASLFGAKNWYQVGLGRMSAGAMLDLGLADVDRAVSVRVFEIVEELVSLGLRLPLVSLTKVADLAGGLGNAGRAAHYRLLADAEEARIAAGTALARKA